MFGRTHLAPAPGPDRVASTVERSFHRTVRKSGMASWNDTMIENFRANAGVVGGHWEGKTLLLLHAIGRKTGKETVYPLVAAPNGDDYVICGSLGGGPTDPQGGANPGAPPAPGPGRV